MTKNRRVDPNCIVCKGIGWGLFLNPPGDWTYSGPCYKCMRPNEEHDKWISEQESM